MFRKRRVQDILFWGVLFGAALAEGMVARVIV